MASLKVKIELQRSAKGVELSKLEKLAKEAQRFLRSLEEDLGIQADGTWVAQGFYDQGVGFDANYQAADIDDIQTQHFVHSLDQVLTVDHTNNWAVSGVSSQTLVQSARLARIADEGETIRVGIYNGSAPAVEWRPLVKSRAESIIEYFETAVRYRGMLQGIIHTWYRQSEPPHFDLRDLASRDLVKCYYTEDKYQEVLTGFRERGSVVMVSGWIEAKRSNKTISKLDVERVKSVEGVTASELEQFFGSAPGWTGDLTTDDFLKIARRRETDGE